MNVPGHLFDYLLVADTSATVDCLGDKLFVTIWDESSSDRLPLVIINIEPDGHSYIREYEEKKRQEETEQLVEENWARRRTMRLLDEFYNAHAFVPL
jgi:hypothetical protein